jgi:hypothetical protein
MHVYVSILKKWDEENDDHNYILVLTDHIYNVLEIEKRIIKLRIFDEVFMVRDREIQDSNFSKIKDFIFFARKLESIYDKIPQFNAICNDYDLENIYINLYLDQTRTSQYLMLKFKNVYLIEDGLGLYREKKITIKELVKNLIFGVPKSFGFDKRISKVEATNPNLLPWEIRSKSHKLDLHELTNKLTKTQKEILADVFIGKISGFDIDNKILIITGPYSEEGIITEEHKVKIYTKLIDEYRDNNIVFLKPHPREVTNYIFAENRNVVVLDRNFPIELLDVFIEKPFKKCIAIDSSSVKNLNCVLEKISLGLDYDTLLYDNYYKKYRYFR